MTLYLIGIGLSDEKDITLKGSEAVKKCKKLYAENYTSKLNVSWTKIEKVCDKKIILADRNLVENNAEETILKDAQKNNVGVLIVGDPFAATTHADLWLRAKKAGIKVEVIHNASIFSAVGVTGLQLYKFGAVASIPFFDDGLFYETPLNIIKNNQSLGLHTLVLLDLQPDKNRFMSVSDGLKYLLEVQSKRKDTVIHNKTKCVACARLGSKNEVIKFGDVESLLAFDFGAPVQCIIIPGKLHFMEEEVLKSFV